MQIQGSYEELEQQEIEEQTLTGSDFCLQLKNLPDYDDNMLLKANLWKHIEDLLEERREGDLKHQKGERKEDTEDGKVACINFGMSNYDFFNFYKKRAEFTKLIRMTELKMKKINKMDEPDEGSLEKL